MKYVELYKLQNDGSQKTIATCSLDEKGEVQCSGDDILVENIKKRGIKDYSSQDKKGQLFLKDGLKFLEQLKFNFTSGYLNASEIKEK